MAQADNPQRVTATVEVVRDEPASEPDDPWLTGAMEAAPNLSDLDACGAMWRKSVEKVKAGELTVPRPRGCKTSCGPVSST